MSLPDQNKSDVTDIRLTAEEWMLNLSIKHNHSALKHQRPNTTPIHCGFKKGDNQLIAFQKQYQIITKKFIENCGNVKKFSELEKGIVADKLYDPICNHVTNFINSSGKSSDLFNYLVGDRNYHKIIVDSQKQNITILHFNSIKPPQDVSAKSDKQYVILTFDNDWKISMRLHTASSRITNSPSLKFDTQALNNPIPKTVISF